MPEPLLPYVLATPRVQRALGLAPAEADAPLHAGAAGPSSIESLAPDRVIDPMRVSSSALVDGIQRLDAVVFGERAMITPRWALYDCAALPGAVIGFGMQADALGDDARQALAIPPDFQGFVPLSMMIAIPMVGAGRWLAYALGSIAPSPDTPDLDAKTLHFGLDLLRAASVDPPEVMAIAQWDSPELSAFAALATSGATSPDLGPRVLASWMPAHDHPATAILQIDLHPRASVPPRLPTAAEIARDLATLSSIDVHDAHALRRLQRDIERGHVIRITGSPCFQGPSRRIPIFRSAAPEPAAVAPIASVAAPRSSTTELHPVNERLLRDLVPFVVATRDHQARLDLSPFGLPIPDAARIDPLRVDSAPFLDLLSRLDALTFGPEGMPMPRWLFLDGSALPAGIVGLAREAASLDPEARALFRLPDDYAGLVPLAMYIAVPTLDRTTWVGHNLASASERLPRRGLEGLGRLAKALGLAVYGARAQIGATQWASRALHVHARLGPLELLSAWTPAHADIATLTYRATIDDATLHHLAGDPAGHVDHPPPDLWIDSASPASMQSLQARIESGERFQIVGPPEHLPDHHQRVPVHRRP